MAALSCSIEAADKNEDEGTSVHRLLQTPQRAPRCCVCARMSPDLRSSSPNCKIGLFILVNLTSNFALNAFRTIALHNYVVPAACPSTRWLLCVSHTAQLLAPQLLHLCACWTLRKSCLRRTNYKREEPKKRRNARQSPSEMAFRPGVRIIRMAAPRQTRHLAGLEASDLPPPTNLELGIGRPYGTKFRITIFGKTGCSPGSGANGSIEKLVELSSSSTTACSSDSTMIRMTFSKSCTSILTRSPKPPSLWLVLTLLRQR